MKPPVWMKRRLSAAILALLLGLSSVPVTAAPTRWYLPPAQGGDPDEPGKTSTVVRYVWPESLMILVSIPYSGTTLVLALRFPQSLATRLGMR